MADSVEDNEPNTKLRAIAAIALACRIGALISLKQIPDALSGWTELLARFGEDDDASVRLEVARGCQVVLEDFSRSKKYKTVVPLAEDFIDRYQASDDPEVRGCVAVVMTVKLYAFKKRRRFVAAYRAGHEFMAYLGPSPEPEVTEAVRLAVKGGDAMIREAQNLYR